MRGMVLSMGLCVVLCACHLNTTPVVLTGELLQGTWSGQLETTSGVRVFSVTFNKPSSNPTVGTLDIFSGQFKMDNQTLAVFGRETFPADIGCFHLAPKGNCTVAFYQARSEIELEIAQVQNVIRYQLRGSRRLASMIESEKITGSFKESAGATGFFTLTREPPNLTNK